MPVNAPATSSTVPGVEWCRCTPPVDRLWNGPRPARISRVIVRVLTKVTTNATNASSSGPLNPWTISFVHQSLSHVTPRA